MDGINQKLTVLKPYARIFIGFSGGLDSCVLLHQLSQDPSIRSKLIAVHVHHGLSPHADKWAEFAEKTAHALDVSFQKFLLNLKQQPNLEEIAREARYQIFASLLTSDKDVLVLAHHQNDQAETVLMHLLRGSGIDGLCGIPEWRALGNGQLYRPLLSFARADLENYAAEHQLSWIEDESNENTHFDRNFLRHEIIPLLQQRWPAAIQNLSRSAQHCGAAKRYIQSEMDEKLADAMDQKKCLSIKHLRSHTLDTQVFLLRAWLAKNNLNKIPQGTVERILNEVVSAKPDARPIVSWKEGCVRRYQEKLYAISSDILPDNRDYSTELNQLKQAHPESHFDIRFRQGGEKMQWRGRTHELKKLFQEWQIPPWERDFIPLVYQDGVLIKVLTTIQ